MECLLRFSNAVGLWAEQQGRLHVPANVSYSLKLPAILRSLPMAEGKYQRPDHTKRADGATTLQVAKLPC